MKQDNASWVEVGATGPEGHETFMMRVCDSCCKPVDVCECGGEVDGKTRKVAE